MDGDGGLGDGRWEMGWRRGGRGVSLKTGLGAWMGGGGDGVDGDGD